jgi:hypothetical protein
MPGDFPLTAEKAAILRFETTADSVVMPDDFQLYDFEGADYWMDGIKPVYPGDDQGIFWDEMRHVVDVQIARMNGVSPSIYNRWPDTWSAMQSLNDTAQSVRGEYPAFHQQTLIELTWKEGIEMYRDMGPFRSTNDFIGRQVRIAAINTWSFEVVAPVNFMLKWHIGMPRPEEVAWMIYTDALGGADVPADLVGLIKSMDLESAQDFTAYTAGCPKHPSFPAMHSAGSTLSYWLPAIAKVTPYQYCEALRVDYATAYGRTVAGVHYQMDNIAGLNIGQRIIREQLPDMLAERYGYDSSMVRDKLDQLSFDWKDFDSEECNIGGIPAAEFLEMAGR